MSVLADFDNVSDISVIGPGDIRFEATDVGISKIDGADRWVTIEGVNAGSIITVDFSDDDATIIDVTSDSVENFEVTGGVVTTKDKVKHDVCIEVFRISFVVEDIDILIEVCVLLGGICDVNMNVDNTGDFIVFVEIVNTDFAFEVIWVGLVITDDNGKVIQPGVNDCFVDSASVAAEDDCVGALGNCFIPVDVNNIGGDVVSLAFDVCIAVVVDFLVVVVSP